MPRVERPHFRPRTEVGRQYAARVSAILRGVEDLEEAALEHVARELERLRANLVEVAARRPALAPLGKVAGAAVSLDVTEIVQAITRLIADFHARATALVIEANQRALDAGALLVDGAFRPALEAQRRRDQERARRERPAQPTGPSAIPPQARAPEGPGITPDPGPSGFGPGAAGRSPTPGTGAGGTGGRLPPVTIAPGADGPGFGGLSLPRVTVEGLYPVVPDQLRRAAAELAAEEVTTLTTRMRQDMVAGVRRAALGGLSPFEVMRAVDQVLPAAKRGARLAEGVGASAERIVRTQVARAANKATAARAEQLASDMRAAGLEKGAAGLRKQWIATLDTRTRLEHLEAHGQTVPVDQPFVVGGEELDHPGDPAGSAANVINCRCRVVTVLPENPEELFAR